MIELIRNMFKPSLERQNGIELNKIIDDMLTIDMLNDGIKNILLGLKNDNVKFVSTENLNSFKQNMELQLSLASMRTSLNQFCNKITSGGEL